MDTGLAVFPTCLMHVSSARQSKPRPAPHCRVLSSGEFNDMIPEPLSVCSEILIMSQR